MARIERDEYGIPTIIGTTALDVARGQGEACAHDRTEQLSWLRRRALGTTSEITDEPVAAEWDRFARHATLTDTAERAFARLSPEAQAFVAAYADGVSAGLASVGEDPWPAWMPLATFHAQQVLFANLGELLWRRHVAALLGPDAVDVLSREEASGAGSNAWVVGGARTASGSPLIGGDPHRVIEAPGVYHQVRLVCTGADDAFDVTGFSFAGSPGVQHFAHAGAVAWAITNACADYQDAEPDPDAPFGFRFRNASTTLGDLGFEALLPLLRARSVDDVSAALAHWVEPVNNVVVADRAGAVRYQIAGRVPEGDGWYTDRHVVDVPPDGQAITANERRGPESARIGTAFAAPYRAQRITELLAGRTGLTAADFVAIHNDTLLASVAALASLVPGAFDGFDGHMRAASPEAGRFAAYRAELVRRVVASDVFDPLRVPCPHGPLFAPWFGLTSRVALALPTWVDEPPFGLDLEALAREALAAVDAGPPVHWGDVHTFAPVDARGRDPRAPEVPLDGDQDCVRCTGSYPAVDDRCSRGPVARYVWDLADRSAGGWVVPMGASEDPASPHHHDQLAAWAEGSLLPLPT